VGNVPADAGNALADGTPDLDVLSRRFRAHVARRPEATALVDGDRRISYAELDAMRAKTQRLLSDVEIRPGQLIGVCVPRGALQWVAVLAVLAQGCAYLPIDPAYPPARKDFLAADSGVAHILEPGGDGVHLRVLAGTGRPRTLPAGTAYVIYTSGSTGQPKGVPVRQSQVARLLSAAQRHFRFRPDDIWSLFHSFSFDFSVWELWGALWNGGSAVVVPHEAAQSPGRLAELLDARAVTVLNQVPSAFGYLVRELVPHRRRLPSLRWVVLGGEPVNLADVEVWTRARIAPAARIVNMYGITETTVHVTFCDLTARSGQPAGPPGTTPIGRPLAHLGVRLIDSDLRPVPAGTPGEIAVYGAGVSGGYLGRPELTAERFSGFPASAGTRIAAATGRSPASTATCTTSAGWTHRSSCAASGSNRPR
jgi:amino acid adenylation domain-containing protein